MSKEFEFQACKIERAVCPFSLARIFGVFLVLDQGHVFRFRPWRLPDPLKW